MKSLIKNFQHDSCICVINEYVNGKVYSIRKSSSTLSGIINLRREKEGIDWYNSQKNSDKIQIIEFQIFEKYGYLKFMCTKGYYPLKSYSYKKNFEVIELCLEHYMQVWGPIIEKFPLLSLYPFHGDLSLSGNILIKGVDLLIVDWEHYCFNGAPIGTDLVYLMLEALYFEYEESGKISGDSMRHVNKMILEMLKKKILSPFFCKGYVFKSLLQFIRNNKLIWGNQYNKFIFLTGDSAITKSFITILDFV